MKEFLKQGDFVVLDWIGDLSKDDIRFGDVIEHNSTHISLNNQYGNISDCEFEKWKNAKIYKLTQI